ncbi:MAG TPA: four helix bundle protein [Anaerolineaceae bacterium]|nr:four helix bundle protein [Anaerolineaceae bacterium]
MQNFQELVVWQKAHELTLAIYQVSRQFPREEVYGLTLQIRRSSASISTNIAEGSGRNGGLDFIRFLQIASGSTSEVEYQLILARDLGYLASTDYECLNAQIVQIRKMLAGLIKSIKSS